jgi:hypothetical protein
MRLIVSGLQGSPTPKLRERGKRLSRWVEILAAKTPAERHAAIRRLPVIITESVPTDGRGGVVKRYVAGGKARLEMFVPIALPAPEEEVEEQLLGGPRVTEGPSRDDCYYEGEPSPCVTQQDIDDLGVVIADAEVEIESLQDDYDTSVAEYEEYCDQNPWDCEGEEQPIASGPALNVFGCGTERVAAAGAIVTAAATTYLAAEAGGFVAGVAATITTTAAAVATGALVGVAVVAAGYAVYSWWTCKDTIVKVPRGLNYLPPFEPVY